VRWKRWHCASGSQRCASKDAWIVWAVALTRLLLRGSRSDVTPRTSFSACGLFLLRRSLLGALRGHGPKSDDAVHQSSALETPTGLSGCAVRLAGGARPRLFGTRCWLGSRRV